MNVVSLTGLLELTLPDRTLRFSDGGFFEFEGEIFRSRDDLFGTISSLQTMEEGVGDLVPAISLTLLPPDTTAAVEICQPGNQTSRARFIIAEYDVDTGLITSSDVFLDGQLDQTNYTFGRNTRRLAMNVVSLVERLFERNIGNTMNPLFHKSIWSGETGHDNATGLTKPVAWGVERASATGGGGGGGGGFNPNNRGERSYAN